jgi:hypothetical protein
MNAANAGTMTRADNPRYGAESQPDGVLTAVTAVVGICASIVAIGLVVAFPGHWPALAGALLIACVPPGAAVMCWVDSDYGVVQAGLTLTISLAVTAIETAVMIWLSAWHPKALFAVTALSALSCALRLRRGGIPFATWTMPARGEGLWARLIPLIVGLAAWGHGISQIHVASISTYGLLASLNPWCLIGLAALLGGGLFELLSSRPRAWLLCAYLVALIAVVYAAVPLLFKVPEYEWVYKHIGIIQSFSTYGKITDPTNIYDQWPALFSTVAAVSGLSKVGPLNFAAWGPLAFELADAILLLGIFRMLAVNRRSAYLALFLYEGFIAWIGQDYLSPQAFGYTLWLGIALIIVRWLLMPGPATIGRGGIVSRLRGRLLVRMPVPPTASPAERGLAWTLIIVMYFAIVAAHQLTPYMVLLGVGALVILGLLWRGWLFLAVLVIVAVSYIIPRYGLVSQFGGLFSGGNALDNAAGAGLVVPGAPEKFTAEFVHVLGVGMWLFALVAIALKWRSLGRVAIPALLAFSPCLIVLVQSYGGEAIYRVFLFSAPWCAMLIADALIELPSIAWRRLLVACACTATLAAGVEGLYGPVRSFAFAPQELTASQWLYSHAPRGSLFVLAADNFPMLEAPDYASFDETAMPSDPTVGADWLKEGDLTAVDQWLASFQNDNDYVVFSNGMQNYRTYFGVPLGYSQLVSEVALAPGWSVVYRNADTTIYRVQVG